GPAGIAVDVPAGAFPTGTTVTMKAVPEAQFPIQLTDEDRQFFTYSGGIGLDFAGAEPRIYLNVSIPAGPSDTDDDQWVVGQILELQGKTLFNTIDRARVIDGRIATSSPPCPGVLAAAVYGLVKSSHPVGLNYAKVALRDNLTAAAV